jgi:hypothetical protein
MASSTQAFLLPGSVPQVFTADGTISIGHAVGYPDPDGLVVELTSNTPILGIAATDAVAGEQVTVVTFGPAYAKLDSAVTWATSPMLAVAASGAFEDAAVDVTSMVRCTPDARMGASGSAGDLVRVVVGVGAFHS